MKPLITVVFTIDRNLHYGRQCVQHLRENGFVDPILKVYPAAPKGTSNRKLQHLSIMDNHYNVIQWFTETYDTKTHDLMVCEDDCEFVEKNSARLVHQQLNILHANYKWSVCVLGQIPYTPMFITAWDRLSRTFYPATSHCYILNGTKLKDHLHRIGRRFWKTPFMTEGWLLLRPWEKFAIFPSIATQNRPIKDLACIPFLHQLPVLKLIRWFEYLMYFMPLIIVVIVLLCKCRRANN